MQFLLFLGIGVLLIWLAVRTLTEEDKRTISEAFSQTDYFWVIVSTLVGLVSHIVRALRWQLIIQSLGFKPKLHNTFFALMVGYLANLAIPRLGEVSRCGMLARYEKIPFTESFGTVIAERAIDLLCLILLFIGLLTFQYEQLWSLTNEKILTPLNEKLSSLIHNPVFIVGLVILSIAAIVGIMWLRKKSKGGNGILDKVKEMALGFWQGLISIKDIKHPVLFILYSAGIWFLYVYVIYLGFNCFKETSSLGFGAALAVTLFGSLGIIFVPGGTGAYQALVTETLTSAYKATFGFAFAFAWLAWSAQFILLLVVGVVSLILLSVLNKDVVKTS